MSERKVGIVRVFLKNGGVKASSFLFSKTMREKVFRGATKTEGAEEVRLYTIHRSLYSAGGQNFGWDYPTFYVQAEIEKTWKCDQEAKK